MMQDFSQTVLNSAEAHFHLANVWSSKGKIERAITGYKMTLRLKPDYWRASLQLGNLMLTQGKVKEALMYYEKTLALHPETSSGKAPQSVSQTKPAFFIRQDRHTASHRQS